MIMSTLESTKSQHPNSTVIPSPIYSFPANKLSKEKYIAITFDDGPHQFLTPKLLDSLKESGTKVTFFVMGIKVRKHPKIIQRAIQEGHDVANHVWNHPVLSRIAYDEVNQQLNDTRMAIANATNGYRVLSMRPPYGNTNKKLNQHISGTNGYPVIMWSLDTLDWKRPTANEIVKKIIEKAKDGTIVLCHDIHPGTIEAIPIAIKQLKEKGFILKTISEMITLHYLQKNLN